MPKKRWVLGLSTAMHLLLADECSQPKDAEIALRAEQAELLIKEFLHLATEIMGCDRMTFVFHQLLHLPQNYRDFGPLYETSAFPHESNWGTLKGMLYSRNVNFLDKEVCNKFALQICLNERLSGHAKRETARFTSKVEGREILSNGVRRALEELIAGWETVRGQHYTVDVFSRGLYNGRQIQVAGMGPHEASRNDSIYLLRNKLVVEVIHLTTGI